MQVYPSTYKCIKFLALGFVRNKKSPGKVLDFILLELLLADKYVRFRYIILTKSAEL